MANKNETLGRTILVVVILCLVCSVIVSGAAIGLKPLQQKNAALDMQRNVLDAAGLLKADTDVVGLFEERVETRLINLNDFTTHESVDGKSAIQYDPRAAARDPEISTKLEKSDDVAGIGTREDYAQVYFINNTDGELETLVGFGEQHHEEAKVSVKRQFIGQHWAARLQINYRKAAVDGSNRTSLDGSYAAVQISDWILSVDALPLWWGPGQDSSLVMSTHARPIEKLQVSRFNNQAFESQWLSWLGPVSFTTFIGQLDPLRSDADDSLLWGSRITARPLPSLELGLSHASQMNGTRIERQGNDLTDIDDNHMLGMDVRYSLPATFGNSAVYAELANDTARNWGSQSAWLAGAEMHFGGLNSAHTLYIEAADTLAKCSDTSVEAGNCFYEHQDYFSGYRHHGQAIGSMYDTDSRALTLGYRWVDNQGTGWQAKLRNIEFNRDDGQPEVGGHPFYDRATKRQQIDIGHRRGFFGGLLEVTVQTWRDQTRGQAWDDVEVGGYLRWEWRF